MAKCPNCNAKLHFWNVKAECPHCHINIPNHNWEQRLEEDAQNREKSFFQLNSNLQMLKYAVIGTPWRLIRLICSVLPLVGFLLPMAYVVGKSGEGEFSLLLMFTGNKDLFSPEHLLEAFKWGSPAEQGLLRALIPALGALLLAVIAFFLVFLLFKHPKSTAIVILHALSLVAYTCGVLLANQTFQSNQNGSLLFGVFLGIAAFALVFLLDIVLLILPVKSEDLRYIPKDELQWDYAISTGNYTNEEFSAWQQRKEEAAKAKG